MNPLKVETNPDNGVVTLLNAQTGERTYNSYISPACMDWEGRHFFAVSHYYGDTFPVGILLEWKVAK